MTTSPVSTSVVEGEAPPLAPSKLGTKQHWDEVYEREVKTFEEIGDEGEVWFGEDSAEDMVEWVVEHYEDLEEEERKSVKVLDVGSGNGDLVFRLLSAGFSSTIGIDYSPSSIALALAIAKKRGLSPSEAETTFRVADIISGAGVEGDEGEWRLVCDKGTYDAISLCGEEKEGRRLVEWYPEAVSRLLEVDGIFLITSCNWTRAELEKAFVGDHTGFEYLSHIPRGSFMFGGATGQSITTVAFLKKK